MEFYYRKITKEDLPIWDKLACNEFLPGDFCSSEYLLEFWDKITGWMLFTEQAELVGCTFNSMKYHDFNPGGIHFLEAIVFPAFRGKGYGKYLIKINFDHSVGYKKSACINPQNYASIALCTKYGFKPAGLYKNWTVFLCNDSYPLDLQNIQSPHKMDTPGSS
jgi:RimJ/RimL family protein N-acetyltransferase